MRQRILSAAVGLCLLAVVFFFFNSLVFNIAIGLVAVLAVYEVLVATKYVENKMLSAVSLIFVAIVPFFRTPTFSEIGKAVCFTFAALLFIILIVKHKTVKIEELGLVFFVSIVVPLSLSSMIYLRDEFPADGLFLVILVFGGAWLTDSGAYFAGRFFGKHKLAPEISPNKTVEGVIGGLIVNIISFFVLAFIYERVSAANGEPLHVSYVWLTILAIATAIIGVLGDLAASIVKRQCSIKDFGNILPGHGGVLDRFDSVLFVAPFVYTVMMAFLYPYFIIR